MMEQQRELAYRCPACDRFYQLALSRFDLPKNRVRIVRCPCGGSKLAVSYTGKGYVVTVPCAICREEHTYRIEKSAFWRAPLYPLSCPRTGVEMCAVGRARPVEEWKAAFEDMLDELYGPEPPLEGSPPYEFCNGRVTLACIEHIKALAEQDEIACQCGGRRMELEVQWDQLVLVCPGCGARYGIPAATARDGDAFLQVTHIQLGPNGPGPGHLHLVT